jgi:hypothetical protein
LIDPDDPPRWWTPKQANEVLPRVAEAVGRAQQAAAGVGERSEQLASTASGNGHAQPSGAAASAFHDVVLELEAEGIVLRDVRQGLVDFPAKAPDGRGYWLCWIVGEPEVGWWHWPEDGFAGRTPLTQPPR